MGYKCVCVCVSSGCVSSHDACHVSQNTISEQKLRNHQYSRIKHYNTPSKTWCFSRASPMDWKNKEMMETRKRTTLMLTLVRPSQFKSTCMNHFEDSCNQTGAENRSCHFNSVIKARPRGQPISTEEVHSARTFAFNPCCFKMLFHFV